MIKYESLSSLIQKIDEPNSTLCRKFIHDNHERLATARGSLANHQNWSGGYLDHITEIMNIANILYTPLNAARPLPFSLSDALLVLFLHDIEKPWKYQQNGDNFELVPLMNTKEKVKLFATQKIGEYGFQLTSEHWNGLRYVEGEHDYTLKERKQGPLAAFAHMCDTWSARGWHNHPLAENDPWDGASRNKK